MKMKRLPEIGERVRYRSRTEWWDRECSGTVRKIYEGYYGNGRACPVGARSWTEHWSAGVEVDSPLPEWWPYPNTNRFAPAISNLTALAKGE